MSRKLHHVGHIVKNLDEGMKLYKNVLGLTPTERGIIELPWGSRMVFFPYAGAYIELIEPAANGNDPAARCLKARGEGLFHISIYTDDFEAELESLRKKGLTIEEYSVPGALPGYTTKLAFLAPEETQGLWVEFIDSANLSPVEKDFSS